MWSFASQLVIKDDGEIYSCDISPNGKRRKIFTMRTPLLGAISAITPFNQPLNMVSHKLGEFAPTRVFKGHGERKTAEAAAPKPAAAPAAA